MSRTSWRGRPVVLVGPAVDDRTRRLLDDPRAVDLLRTTGELRVSDAPTGSAQFRLELQAADALVLTGGLAADDLDGSSRLQVVSVMATGYEFYVDAEAVRLRGIRVGYVPSYGADAVAEHALALALAASKNVVPASTAVRAGEWPHPVSTQLTGRTAGVVGLGPIGMRMVQLLEGIGMEVVVWTRSPDPGRLLRTSARFVSLERLFATSSVISVHAALTPQTRGLITAELLSRCPVGAVFVNTARAELVSVGALETAVTRGAVRAGVDVLRSEPPSAAELADLPASVVVTPHTAYNTNEAALALLLGAIDNVRLCLAGAPMTGEVAAGVREALSPTMVVERTSSPR